MITFHFITKLPTTNSSLISEMIWKSDSSLIQCWLYLKMSHVTRAVDLLSPIVGDGAWASASH